MQASIAAAFAARGVAVEVHRADTPEAARSQAASTAPESFDGIICAGGDGTLFAVVNGRFDSGRASALPLGVLPLGTGNAFARDLGLRPWDWQAAVAMICEGQIRPLDAVRVACENQGYHCVNVLGAGFVVAAAQAAQRFKWLGSGAYTAGMLMALLKLRSFPLKLEADGELIETDATLLTISNSRYTGTDFEIAPRARFDDGLLDLMVVRAVTRRRLLQVFPRAYSGRHIDQPEVTCRQVRQLRLLAPEGLPLAADGEFAGASPATIECVPGALRLFASSECQAPQG